MSDMALFDLKPEDNRPGHPDDIHLLMPNMAYACGENIVSVKGHYAIGCREDIWATVTCPACRDNDLAELRRISRKMQGRPPE